MLDIFFFQRLKLSLFCISVPQERRKERISAMFIALELHPCSLTSGLMPKDHSAFQKGFRRSFLQSRDQRWGEKKLEIKRKISGRQEGCAPGLKPPGSHAGKELAEAPVTSGPLSHLSKAANRHTAERGCSH